MPVLQDEHESPGWLEDGVPPQRSSWEPALGVLVKAQVSRVLCTCSPRLTEASSSEVLIPPGPMALQLCQLTVVLLVFVYSMFSSSVAIVLPDMFSFPL